MKFDRSKMMIAVAAFGVGCATTAISGQETSQAVAEAPNPAFMIVTGTVTDRETFGREYAAKLPPLYEKYGGVYLAVGAGHDTLEGEADYGSHVVSRWPSRSAAMEFWNSEEYAPLRQRRIDEGWGAFDVVVFEGLPTPKSISPLAEKAADSAK